MVDPGWIPILRIVRHNRHVGQTDTPVARAFREGADRVGRIIDPGFRGDFVGEVLEEGQETRQEEGGEDQED